MCSSLFYYHYIQTYKQLSHKREREPQIHFLFGAVKPSGSSTFSSICWSEMWTWIHRCCSSWSFLFLDVSWFPNNFSKSSITWMEGKRKGFPPMFFAPPTDSWFQGEETPTSEWQLHHQNISMRLTWEGGGDVWRKALQKRVSSSLALWLTQALGSKLRWADLSADGLSSLLQSDCTCSSTPYCSCLMQKDSVL